MLCIVYTLVQRSPLYGACLFGNTDVVALLMKRGAIVDMKCLEEAVTEGYEYVCVCVCV